MKQNKSQGMALISLLLSLIVAAIVMIILIKMYTGTTKNLGGGEKSTKTPIERAKGAACIGQRRSLETTIQVYYIEKNQYPSQLSDLDGFTEENFQCPLTHNPYNYNPSTGKVTCPDHP